MSIRFRIFVGLVFSFSVTACSMATTALKEQGSYLSPGKMCTVILKVSPQGGFLQLFVQGSTGKLVHMANDVTGFLWEAENSLVFSSSPIYGKPGVFEVACDHERPSLKVLVAPENIDSAYPDGADYFELKEIKGRSLQFFYGHNVDNIDFKEFRTEKYLRSVLLP